MYETALLLGHRGAPGPPAVAENSLSSFDRCLEKGCDGFELDVRLSQDNIPVICHDAVTGGCEIAGTRAAELTCLPTLGDVLRRYCHRCFLDIELKVPGLESLILEDLRNCRLQSNFVVSSFLPEVLIQLRVRTSFVPLGLICESEDQLALWRDIPTEFVMAHESLVNESLVAQLHAAKRKLVVWTVNHQASMERLAEWEVDGIISDDSELLVRTLRPHFGK